MATRQSAALACRCPSRASRWRLVMPDEAGIGATPRSLASFGTHPIWSVAQAAKAARRALSPASGRGTSMSLRGGGRPPNHSSWQRLIYWRQPGRSSARWQARLGRNLRASVADLPVDTYTDALALINSNPCTNGVSIFTRDGEQQGSSKWTLKSEWSAATCRWRCR